MGKKFKKSYILVPMFLLLLTVFAYSTIVVTNTYAASFAWTAVTISSANVRTGPNTSANVVATYSANTHVTVYQTTSAQSVWGGISTWYRISSLSSAPRYIYGGLLSHASAGSIKKSTPPPAAQVHAIKVSLSRQTLYAYLNGRQVYTTPVTTGMPQLQTPTGTWKIFRKLTNIEFISPWPKGSPYYYAPEHVDYAMEYSGLLYLHSATWRSVFGPGTQYPHNDPKFGWESGSHGCINLPLNAAAWLYRWAPIGTTITVQN